MSAKVTARSFVPSEILSPDDTRMVLCVVGKMPRKRAANKRDVPYQSLIKMRLAEKVDKAS